MTRPAEHALITQMLEAIEWLTTGTQMVGDSHWSISNEALENGIKAYDAAREYLAAPVVEPVAWAHKWHPGSYKYGQVDYTDVISPEEHDRVEGQYTVPLYTHPAPVAAKSTEPVNQQLLERILETYDMGGVIFPSDLEELRAIVAAQGAKV